MNDTDVRLVLIAAMDRNGAIGAGNTLPWKCPKDMRHFRTLTMGKCVLMGRRTAMSLGKPLKGRTNIVLTNSGWRQDGFVTVGSIEAAKRYVAAQGYQDLWIIGGGALYDATIDIADVVHLTALNIAVEDADTWFPTDRLGQYKGAVVQGCDDPNVHFWTFTRGTISTSRKATGPCKQMGLNVHEGWAYPPGASMES